MLMYIYAVFTMQESHTPTIVTLGLAGGQGKSTVALMLGRYLGRLGIPVLFVDADPQSSLTSFLDIQTSTINCV